MEPKPATSFSSADKPEAQHLLLSQVISALSYALDLTEGQPPGHCVRCCWMGAHMVKAMGLDGEEAHDVYYTLLLKDAGCSSNAARLCQLYGSDDHVAKKDWKFVNDEEFSQLAKFVLSHTGLQTGLVDKFKKILTLVRNGEKLANEVVHTRCERGASIALQLGFNQAIADGIRGLDEHYNGKGRPEGLKGRAIPLASRVALLTQVADVFYMAGGKKACLREIENRKDTWLDPELVSVFNTAAREDAFWQGLEAGDLTTRVAELEPEGTAVEVTEERLDNIVRAFAQVVDAKSPYTAGHSERVGLYAGAISDQLGFSPEQKKWVVRAALLHDLGKLGVSNTILDKPGKLDEREWAQMKRHPMLTEDILSRLDFFKIIAPMAGAHHERFDGLGYYKGLKGDAISLETRIITTADIFDALSADRPYRGAMPLEKALAIMDDMEGTQLDSRCLAALKGSLSGLGLS